MDGRALSREQKRPGSVGGQRSRPRRKPRLSESSPAISAPPPIPGQSAGGKKKLPVLYPFSRARALRERLAGLGNQAGGRMRMMEEGTRKRAKRVNFHRPTHDCPEKPARPPCLPSCPCVRTSERPTTSWPNIHQLTLSLSPSPSYYLRTTLHTLPSRTPCVFPLLLYRHSPSRRDISFLWATSDTLSRKERLSPTPSTPSFPPFSILALSYGQTRYHIGGSWSTRNSTIHILL